jgi:hypothetical protein
MLGDASKDRSLPLERRSRMGVFKKGCHWYIDYYVKGMRKRKKIGPSKQVAELALAQVEVKIAKGEYLGIYEEKKVTFRQFVPEHFKIFPVE